MDALHDNALESLSAADFLVKKFFTIVGYCFSLTIPCIIWQKLF